MDKQKIQETSGKYLGQGKKGKGLRKTGPKQNHAKSFMEMKKSVVRVGKLTL